LKRSDSSVGKSFPRETALLSIMDGQDPPREAIREDPKRKVIRELIMHENQLSHQRRSYFAVLQGLLWTAAGLVLQSDLEARADLITILAVLGAVLALVLGFSMEVSWLAVKQLVDGLDNGDIRDPTPVIGFYAPQDERPEGAYEKLTAFLNNWNLAKYAFTAAWIGFAVVVNRK
jgi:hypothetical protein